MLQICMAKTAQGATCANRDTELTYIISYGVYKLNSQNSTSHTTF